MDAVTLISMLLYVITDLAGMLLNSILSFLVIKKTSKELRSYSILILNFAVCDFTASFSSLLTQVRLIPSTKGIFLVSYGPCQLLGDKFCYIAVCIMAHCYPHGLYTLLFSFYYRYYVFSHAPHRPQTIVFIILLFYIPSFLQLVFASLAFDTEADVRKQLREELCYNITDASVSGIKITDWKSVYGQMHMILPAIPIYACILILRGKIIVLLRIRTMSERTRQMHSQLLKLITMQACLPAVFIISTTNFVLSELDIYHSPILEFASHISIGLIPVLTPLLSLYFIAPYRKWLVGRLQCRDRSQADAIVQFSTSNIPTHLSSRLK